MKIKVKTNKEGGKTIIIKKDDNKITAVITVNASNKFMTIEHNKNFHDPGISDGLPSWAQVKNL